MTATVLLSDVMVAERVKGHRDVTNAYPVVVSFPVATTQLDETDDKILFYPFPPRTLVHQILVNVPSSDTGTALIWDMSTASATDGTVGTQLIAAATTGRSSTAGTKNIDSGKAATDVSSTYLMLHTKTAATTPVAGTWTVYLLLSQAPATVVGVSTVSTTRLAGDGEDMS